VPRYLPIYSSSIQSPDPLVRTPRSTSDAKATWPATGILFAEDREPWYKWWWHVHHIACWHRALREWLHIRYSVYSMCSICVVWSGPNERDLVLNRHILESVLDIHAPTNAAVDAHARSQTPRYESFTTGLAAKSSRPTTKARWGPLSADGISFQSDPDSLLLHLPLRVLAPTLGPTHRPNLLLRPLPVLVRPQSRVVRRRSAPPFPRRPEYW